MLWIHEQPCKTFAFEETAAEKIGSNRCKCCSYKRKVSEKDPLTDFLLFNLQSVEMFLVGFRKLATATRWELFYNGSFEIVKLVILF